MDVQAVATAIMAPLKKLGLHGYDYGPDSPASPAAYIYPETLPFHGDLDEEVTATFIVRFLIQSTATKSGQQQLNALISTGVGSAKAAIEADHTLDGAVNSVSVTSARAYGVVTIADGATRYYSAELVVEVLA